MSVEKLDKTKGFADIGSVHQDNARLREDNQKNDARNLESRVRSGLEARLGEKPKVPSTKEQPKAFHTEKSFPASSSLKSLETGGFKNESKVSVEVPRVVGEAPKVKEGDSLRINPFARGEESTAAKQSKFPHKSAFVDVKSASSDPLKVKTELQNLTQSRVAERARGQEGQEPAKNLADKIREKLAQQANGKELPLEVAKTVAPVEVARKDSGEKPERKRDEKKSDSKTESKGAQSLAHADRSSGADHLEASSGGVAGEGHQPEVIFYNSDATVSDVNFSTVYAAYQQCLHQVYQVCKMDPEAGEQLLKNVNEQFGGFLPTSEVHSKRISNVYGKTHA